MFERRTCTAADSHQQKGVHCGAVLMPNLVHVFVPHDQRVVQCGVMLPATGVGAGQEAAAGTCAQPHHSLHRCAISHPPPMEWLLGPLHPRSLMAVLQSIQQYKSHEQRLELRREQRAPHQISGRSGQTRKLPTLSGETALRCRGPWSWTFACRLFFKFDICHLLQARLRRCFGCWTE